MELKQVLKTILIIALVAVVPLAAVSCDKRSKTVDSPKVSKNKTSDEFEFPYKTDSSDSTSKTKNSSTTSTTKTTKTTTTTSTTTTTTTTTPVNVKPTPPAKRDLSQFKGKKLIAFTFDDGPSSAQTPKLLDGLNKYNARVTFFVLGNRVNSYKNTIIRAYNMGNQIGSHTYSHCNLAKLSDAELAKEVSKSKSAIENILGVTPTVLRPPYGSMNDKVKSAAGTSIVTWSVDPLDWKYKNADTVCNNIVNNSFDGAIVLVHDLYETSVQGALMAMDKLSKQGYAFVTVEELAELRGVTMENGKVYNSFKP